LLVLCMSLPEYSYIACHFRNIPILHVTSGIFLYFWALSIDVYSKLLENHNVSEAGWASVFRWGDGDTYQWVRSALSKEPNRVGVSLTSAEDPDRPSFRNIVFSSYLELWAMDKLHKSSPCVIPTFGTLQNQQWSPRSETHWQFNWDTNLTGRDTITM
jgi:hypothetical protein